MGAMKRWLEEAGHLKLTQEDQQGYADYMYAVQERDLIEEELRSEAQQMNDAIAMAMARVAEEIDNLELTDIGLHYTGRLVCRG